MKNLHPTYSWILLSTEQQNKTLSLLLTAHQISNSCAVWLPQPSGLGTLPHPQPGPPPWVLLSKHALHRTAGTVAWPPQPG